jgi:hypothetical protein
MAMHADEFFHTPLVRSLSPWKSPLSIGAVKKVREIFGIFSGSFELQIRVQFFVNGMTFSRSIK